MYSPKNIPSKPGIYKMMDEDKNVLYVGKAKDLKKRVSSYFRKSTKHGARIAKMISQVKKVETVVVSNEEEALILENNLIKEYKPKYNVLLRDDKNFLYIKFTNEDFPKIELVRKRIKDGGYYIGPKTSVGIIRESLDMLRKIYPFRTCKMGIAITENKTEKTKQNVRAGFKPAPTEIKNEKTLHVQLSKVDRKTPCLDYHIGKCGAPCIGLVTPEEYKEMFEAIKGFFKGKYEDIANQLEEKMYKYAENKKFEQAAQMRDLIKKIHIMKQKQIIIGANDFSDMDVIGLARHKDKALVKLLVFREGKMVSEETMFITAPSETEDSEIVEKFVFQYYAEIEDIPKEIISPEKTRLSIERTKIIVPKLGRKKELLELAKKNASVTLDREKARFEKDETSEIESEGLEILKDILKLKNIPKRIECYDISHLGGTHTYASMVVFEDGKPNNSDYRRFKIETVMKDSKIDDFASMNEALSRRLKRLIKVPNKNKSKKEDKKKEIDSFAKTPDLIVIDGGKGQLSSSLKARNELKLKIPFISIAKKEEEIFIPGKKEPILLPRNNEALKIIQQIRDEAHRFAITSNRNARNKAQKESILDTIPGIGPGTKKKLMKKFGSLTGIKKASEKEIIDLIGTQKTLILKQYL